MTGSSASVVNLHWVLAQILSQIVKRYDNTMTARYGLPGPELIPMSSGDVEALRQTVSLLTEEAKDFGKVS